MGDGARLAIAILILFLAMVAFFFAFHPGGVEGATGPVGNPGDILKFMFGQFDAASSGTAATNGPQGDGGTNNVGPGSANNSGSAGLTNLPGTNVGPGVG